MQGDVFNLRGFESVHEEARENSLHADRDRKSVGDKGIPRRIGIFDLHRCVTAQANLAGEMQCGAFAIDGVLR